MISMTNLRVTLCRPKNDAASRAALLLHMEYMNKTYGATSGSIMVVPREGEDDLEITLVMDEDQYDAYNRIDANGQRDIHREWQKLLTYCYAGHMQRI